MESIPSQFWHPCPAFERHKNATVDKVLQQLYWCQSITKAAIRDQDFTDTESFSDDDEDLFGPETESTIDYETERRLEPFIRALPSCYLLTIESDHGFYCPCGRKMEHWRSLAGCEYIYDWEFCPKENVFSNRASLMAHLYEHERRDMYHQYIVVYLNYLYFA